MKITINQSYEVEFGTLRVGATFIDTEYDSDAILMVVEPGIEITIKPDAEWVDDDEFNGYAVCLNDGQILGYKNDEKVIPVNTELIVTK